MTEIYIPTTPLIIAKDKYNSGNFYANSIKNQIVTKEGSVINPFNELNLWGAQNDKKDIELFYKNKNPNEDISYNEIVFIDPSLIYMMTIGDTDMNIKKNNMIFVGGGGGGGTYNGETSIYNGISADVTFLKNTTYIISIGKGGRGGIGISSSENNGGYSIITGDMKLNTEDTIRKEFSLYVPGGRGGNNRSTDNRTSGYTFNTKEYGYGGDKLTFINGLTYYVSEGYVNPDPEVAKNQRMGYVTNITDNAQPLYNIFRPLRCNYYWWYPYEPWKYDCVNGNRPFSIFFAGYFYAKTAGNYTFATISDDDSWIYINFVDKNTQYRGQGNFYANGYYHVKYGRKVAENGGQHGPQRSADVGPEPAGYGLPSGTIRLEANTVYRIYMIFKQNYGGANFTAWVRTPEGWWITDGTGYYYSDKPGQNNLASLSKLNGGNGLIYLKYNINKSVRSSVNNDDITKQITQNFGSDALIVKPVSVNIPSTANEEDAKKIFIEDLKKKCISEKTANGISTADCNNINTKSFENFANPDLLTSDDPYTGDIVNMINEFEKINFDINNYSITKNKYYKSQEGVITLYKLTLMTLLLNEIYFNIKVLLGTYLVSAANTNITYNLLNSIVLNFNSTTAGVGTFALDTAATGKLATITINLKNNYDYLFFKNVAADATNAKSDSKTTATTTTTFSSINSSPIAYSYTFLYFTHGFYNFSTLKKKGFATINTTTDSFGFDLNNKFYNYLVYRLYYLFNVKDNILAAQTLNLYHTTNILIYKLKLYYAINIYTGTVTDKTLKRIYDKLDHYITINGTGNLIPNGIKLGSYGVAVSNVYTKPFVKVADLKNQYDKKDVVINAKAANINDNRTKLNSVINQYNNDKQNINGYTLFSYVLYIILIFLILVFAVIVMSQSLTDGLKIIYSGLIFIFILFMLLITYIYYGTKSSTIEKFSTIVTANSGLYYLYDIYPCIKYASNATNNSPTSATKWNLYDLNNYDGVYTNNILSTAPTLHTAANDSNTMIETVVVATTTYDILQYIITANASLASMPIITTTKCNKFIYNTTNLFLNDDRTSNTDFSSILYNYSIQALTNSSLLFIVRDNYLYDIFLMNNGTPSATSGAYVNDNKNKYSKIKLTGASASASVAYTYVVLQFFNDYDDYTIDHASRTIEKKIGEFIDNFNGLVTSYLFNLQLNISFLDTIQLYEKTNDALTIKQKNVDNYFKIYENKQSVVKSNQNLLKYDMLFKYNLNNSLCYIFLLSLIVYVLYIMYPSLYNILLTIWCILLVVIILIFLMSITFPVRTKTSKSYWLKPSKDTISQL
jgi:hypothetical protein